MKQQIKQFIQLNLLYPLKRRQTQRKWHRQSYTGVPVVIGNAMPKSGSKLLEQILHGLTQLTPLVEYGLDSIRSITVDGRTRSQQEIEQDLMRLKPGDVVLTYLHATPVNQSYLTRPNWASYFIYRDPRDLLISHIFYAVDMNPNHAMHTYYQPLNMEERLRTAIQGIHQENLNLPDVRTRYDRHLGWLSCPQVMSIRFEQLVAERENILEKMLSHFEAAGGSLSISRSQAVQALLEAMDPKRSSTFRKGKSGGWKEYFSDKNKKLFKEVAGDLLIRLGYEVNNDW